MGPGARGAGWEWVRSWEVGWRRRWWIVVSRVAVAAVRVVSRKAAIILGGGVERGWGWGNVGGCSGFGMSGLGILSAGPLCGRMNALLRGCLVAWF